MSVYRCPYRLSYYLTHPHKLIRHCYLVTKWFIQRGMRGYSDADTWSIDWYLCSWMPQALAQLRDRKIGHPVDVTPEQWDECMAKMIVGFKAAARIGDYGWDSDEERKFLFHDSKVGLQTFAERFFDLWD